MNAISQSAGTPTVTSGTAESGHDTSTVSKPSRRTLGAGWRSAQQFEQRRYRSWGPSGWEHGPYGRLREAP